MTDYVMPIDEFYEFLEELAEDKGYFLDYELSLEENAAKVNDSQLAQTLRVAGDVWCGGGVLIVT